LPKKLHIRVKQKSRFHFESITIMKKNDYPVIIYQAEEGGFVAEIPALAGCLAQGDSLIECLDKLETVKARWLETAKLHNQPIPDVENVYRKMRNLSV
jgi:antitoxin HicB